MRYLVTGHTGFKGAWLSMWLASEGHEVSGLALDPLPGSLFETADVTTDLVHDIRQDIRDPSGVRAALATVQPEVVLHLAAQPLVRESYLDPRTTMETNVMGTLNVLEAVQGTDSVRAQVIVTTDKVYRNVNQAAGYVEDDALGGHDPYSASKAMADLLTSSWLDSFPGCPSATARAGNVIGGGDVSPDRLLPDLISSFRSGAPAQLRYPDAVRPWQHVLDCLAGYRALVDALLSGTPARDGRNLGAWNFGPGPQGFVTVGALADLAASRWGSGASWQAHHADHPHEAGLLALDAHKAETQLNWRNRLDVRASVDWTIDWFRSVDAGLDPRTVSLDQIRAFERVR